MGRNNTGSRVWLEVDLKAIRQNFKRIARMVFPSGVMVVLKADAYGLGTGPIARTLCKAGATRLGLAEIKEAVPLLGQVKVPLQILGSLLKSEIPAAVSMGIVCPVTDYGSARLLSAEAVRQGKLVRVHFLIDTGMGRLGIPHYSAAREIRKCLKLPNLDVEGIYSHFSNANNTRHPKTREQLSLFKTVLRQLPEVNFPLVHMANSDAINNFKPSYFNMVRTGINLYGVFDLQGRRIYNLKPTLALKTRLIARRKLPAGHTIGYGCTHSLFRDTLVGTIPAGYADGIPMAAGNSARVLISGRECPIIGRISMDYVTVDLTSCPRARLGDTVTIFGRSGNREITVEDWAKIKQSHPYDIICSLGKRVERVYKD
ncbi:alanine racemase [Fibrobacterota bacterium]